MYLSWLYCCLPLHVIVKKLFPYVQVFRRKNLSGFWWWHHSSIDVDALWGDFQLSLNHSLFSIRHFYWFSEGNQSIWAYTMEFFAKDLRLTFVKFLCSNMLFKSNETQIQRNIQMSVDVKSWIALLGTNHLLQPTERSSWYRTEDITLIFSRNSWFVMIGDSYLKPFHDAVMRALVASTQPPDFPITLPRYWKNETA